MAAGYSNPYANLKHVRRGELRPPTTSAAAARLRNLSRIRTIRRRRGRRVGLLVSTTHALSGTPCWAFCRMSGN
ncbi:MAG TPA: hypothetical protein VN853_20460 [Polyangia bacterium]|nr:hypothetical protein [Polyangia bacterium]